MNNSRRSLLSLGVAGYLTWMIAGPAYSQVQVSYDSLYNLASGQLRDGDANSALNTCERARKLDASRYECFIISAGALKSQNRYEAATEMLYSGLAVAPEDKKAAFRASIAAMRTEPSSNAPVASQPVPTQAEIILWKTIENSSNAADFRAYLSQYPKGAFVVLANIRLQAFVWVDPATKLMWANHDVLSLVNQTTALAYCKNLNVAGFQQWRLPEISELQQIYDPAVFSNGAYAGRGGAYVHVKGGMRITQIGVWSTTPGPAPGDAWLFNFYDGSRETAAVGGSGIGQALCVRREAD